MICLRCKFNKGEVYSESLGMLFNCGFYTNSTYIPPKKQCKHFSFYNEKTMTIKYCPISGDATVEGDIDIGTALGILAIEARKRSRMSWVSS